MKNTGAVALSAGSLTLTPVGTGCALPPCWNFNEWNNATFPVGGLGSIAAGASVRLVSCAYMPFSGLA